MTRRKITTTLVVALFTLIMGCGIFLKYGVQKNHDTLLSKLHVFIFNGNELNIEIADKINPKTVKITQPNGTVLFENGKLIGSIENEYGHTVFKFIVVVHSLHRQDISRRIGGMPMYIISPLLC